MKTQVLRSVTILALTASIYAVMVAFTTVSKSMEPKAADFLESGTYAGTIEHWVTSQLGYPKLLEREEGNVAVLVSLKVDESGHVEVIACDTALPELTDYVKDKINGQKALVSDEYYGHDFEIKINFRQMNY